MMDPSEERELNKQLLRYLNDKVAVSASERSETRRILNKYITNGHVWRFIVENCKIPLRGDLLYTGSMYDGLKTQAADEVDVMIPLKIRGGVEVEERAQNRQIPHGFARLKLLRPGEYGYDRFLDYDDYLKVDKVYQHLESLVDRAINQFEINEGISLRSVKHGPAVQLDVYRYDKKLMSIDLVMAFEVSGEFYVTKKYSETAHSCDRYFDISTLFRQSFSLKEKEIFNRLDGQGNGCKKEVLKIMKTIVSTDNSQLRGNLTSYHLKNAFLRHLDGSRHLFVDWSNIMISQRFLGFLTFLVVELDRNFPSFFIPEMTLLDVMETTKLEMKYRLQRIINSSQLRRDILKSEPMQEVNPEEPDHTHDSQGLLTPGEIIGGAVIAAVAGTAFVANRYLREQDEKTSSKATTTSPSSSQQQTQPKDECVVM
ncbi:cyclic GMP-AMP synthase-like isoform X2 [Nematostella vectensis]|uniref:cyclic GMP-AMP synthase-like isoform X2 n=1 Tax=Nematostella vectensis TaxID=45351 RepID=UPI0020776D18|nr:cyclic GMP-AMP synthase-like isoform X2 [Nematostella vectensis]